MGDDLAGTMGTPNGNGQARARKDLTIRLTAWLSLLGVILLGVLCWWREPAFEGGTMLVIGTLTGLLSGIVGGKLGIARPNHGSPISGETTGTL